MTVLAAFGFVANWAYDQKRADRIWVVLKVHRDFFGEAKDLQNADKTPYDKRNHKVDKFIGFYLPPFEHSPYRLREMANALMSPFEADNDAPGASLAPSTAPALHAQKTNATLASLQSEPQRPQAVKFGGQSTKKI